MNFTAQQLADENAGMIMRRYPSALITNWGAVENPSFIISKFVVKWKGKILGFTGTTEIVVVKGKPRLRHSIQKSKYA